MPADLQKARELFLHAVGKLPTDQWEGYVAEACLGDTELQRQVSHFLQIHREAGSFLDQPVAAVGAMDAFLPEAEASTIPLQENPGTMIGPYKLLQQIGEGGFGVVFMAEQLRPVCRKVALKVVKPGMDTRQVVARFEAERQALALMDHPNIARVFDGGETASGRPYFVMELVRGVPVTEFCDKNQLSVRRRLELFIHICRAVHHAHQKGIIHRDIKPSNLLVTSHDGTPVGKVIDFGIAKAMGQRLTDKTLFTNFAQIIGTPLYMSPEQAEMSGLDIDTRSDIYSLGVVLYELLTGTTPFDDQRLRRVSYDEMRRIIREEEPAKPSARVSTLGPAAQTTSSNRESDPVRLSRLIRGELDWIVMKALEKDRNRRYESASALAADVHRYLNNESVQACPPSAWYRFRKFGRRNRVALATATAVALALLGGAGVAAWQAVAATRSATSEKKARELAQSREAETLAVLNFVQDYIFAAAQPKGQERGLGRDVTMREAVESALRFVDQSFAGEPLIEAQLRMSLGQSFYFLGNSKIALEQFQRARAIFTEHHGSDHPDTIRSMLRVANALLVLGRVAEACTLNEEAFELAKRVLGHDAPDTLAGMSNLSICYDRLGRQADALRLREDALTLSKRVFGTNHPQTFRAMNNLGNSFDALARHPEALALRRESLELHKAHPKLGPKHPDTLLSMNNVAVSLSAIGQTQEARELYEKTLAYKKERLGADHPDTLLTAGNLASLCVRLGKTDEALKLREEILSQRMAHPNFGPDHAETWLSMDNLAIGYQAANRHDEALKLRVEVLTRRQSKLAFNHPDTLKSLRNVVTSLVNLGRRAEAIPLIDDYVRLAAGTTVNQRIIAELLDLRMRHFEKSKDASGCRATAEMWESLSRTDPDSLYNAACYRAVTAAVIRATYQSDVAVKQAEVDESLAMEWLRKAIAAGYKDAGNVDSDKDLTVLRDREDFKHLLAELRVTSPPK